MRIVLDGLGTDRAPGTEVAGAVAALRELEDVEIILVGDQELLRAELDRQEDYPRARLHIEHAADRILPGTPAATVSDDNLTELVRIDTAGALSVRGFDAHGGPKSVCISHQGQSYVAEAQVEAPPKKLVLEGPFAFRLEPTMDNRC